jgi:hypothetical protein
MVVDAFKCLAFIFLILLTEMPIIFLAGSDQIVGAPPNPLNTVFREQNYQDLLSNIAAHQYTKILTHKNSGINQFLKFYANSLTGSNTTMLMREYKYQPNQFVLAWCRTAKALIEKHLSEFRMDSQKVVWVLTGFEE